MCGIFAAINARKAAELVVVGLHAIQHRARDWAGIVATDGANLFREFGPGIVRQAFTVDKLNRLHGLTAIGHIRYPTVKDDKSRDNVQPVMGIYNGRAIAIVHNGNLTNVEELRSLLGNPKQATSLDTELIVRLLEQECSGNLVKDLGSVLLKLRGSFALVALTPDLVIAASDPQGNRPLSIGARDFSWFVSSETCAFPNVGARFKRDVRAGEMVVFDGLSPHPRSVAFADQAGRSCPFEYIYFSHPASSVFGKSVTKMRISIGKELAKLYPIKADLVSPIPDSSNYMAIGYANANQLLYLPVIHRNHYVGRTFIAATQADRDTEVERKFVFDAHLIENARIVLVDDSIVRGTTAPRVINRLRTLGAKEVHMLVGSPRIKGSCRYGINTPTTEELLASHCGLEEMRKQIGADTLQFLPLESLRTLVGEPEEHCFACMDGKYW